MQDPTVTVIVPTYRRPRYLREAVSSALGQTRGDFEIIISDDDASAETARYVASLNDPRVHYRRNERTLGIVMNSVAAFSEARGKYIACLNDDDVWEPDFLEALVPPLEADAEITVAFSDHHLIDEEGRLLPEREERNTRFYSRSELKPGRQQPFIRPVVVSQAIPMVMAAVFRASILDGAGFSPRMGGSYDFWLAYLAVRGGKPCYYVPRRLTRYRLHGNSGTMSRGVSNLRENIYVRRKLLRTAELVPYAREIRNGIGVYYGKMALYYLEHGAYHKGRVILKKAFHFLNRPKNIAALAVSAILALCKAKSR